MHIPAPLSSSHSIAHRFAPPPAWLGTPPPASGCPPSPGLPLRPPPPPGGRPCPAPRMSPLVPCGGPPSSTPVCRPYLAELVVVLMCCLPHVPHSCQKQTLGGECAYYAHTRLNRFLKVRHCLYVNIYFCAFNISLCILCEHFFVHSIPPQRTRLNFKPLARSRSAAAIFRRWRRSVPGADVAHLPRAPAGVLPLRPAAPLLPGDPRQQFRRLQHMAWACH